MEDVRREILAECERLQENCLYTSTSLFIWLRALRAHRRIFIFGQVVFSVAAAGAAVGGQALLAGGFGAVAGLSPMVWDALKMDGDINLVEHHASLFVELRDRFRQVRLIEDARGMKALEQAFEEAKADMAIARKSRVTPPERFYKMAKAKIHAGDYDNAIDDAAKKLANGTLPP
ncbi:MAG: hypothetical protein R3B98_02525 [Hyphomonas sp.]